MDGYELINLYFKEEIKMAFIDELRNKSDMHEIVEKEVVNE